MAKKKVRVVDHGWTAAIARMRELGTGAEIGVGVTGPDADFEVEPGFNMASLAATHEFGSKKRNIPERSFLRSGIDMNRAAISSVIEKVAREVSVGTIDPGVALERIGLLVVGLIRARIRQGIAPKLKPATIAAKARIGGTNKDTPLIRTGRLLNSITHVVRAKGSSKS